MKARKIGILALTFVFLVSLVFGGTGAAMPSLREKSSGHAESASEYVPGEIIVKFKPGVRNQTIAKLNSRHGTSVRRTSRFAGFKVLRIPKGRTVSQMVKVYNKNPNVEYAEPNYIAHAFMVPNDFYYSYQWHLDNAVYGGINMESAWDVQTGDPEVIVAVIDTGVAYEDFVEAIPIGRSGRYKYTTYACAPDLAETSFAPGYDFVNNDSHANDDEGHGTHVTGTIAQSTNNGLGVAGVAFNTSIMPVKVLDSSGSGSYDQVADGIYYAADQGAQVINMSLGGSSSSATLENALANAYGKGVTIICASGNDGSATTVSYPAAYDDYCIAVGATRYDEQIAYYSNGGPSLDLTAPGGQLYIEGTMEMLDQNGDDYWDGVLQQTFGDDPSVFNYYFYQGTSMAAPHVAGVAALVIANGVTGPDNVREALEQTAEDKGEASVEGSNWDPVYGYGIVDAYAALNYISVPNDPPVAVAGGPYSGTEDVAVEFNGSGSSDPNGDPLTYSWNFGDGSTGTGVNPTHIYTTGGLYTITLVVNDGREDSAISTTTATMTEVNDPPVAVAGPDQTALVGQTVTFDGSGSYDIDDGIGTYQWDFGDGNTGTGMTTIHAYADVGEYIVTLTVTDNGDLTDVDTATVTVTEQSMLFMHVASIEMSTKRAGPNVSAIAKVTVVDGSGAPVGGATVSGHWTELTGDTDSGVTDENGTVSLKSDKVRNVSGTFTFTVDEVTKVGYTYNPDSNLETSKSITVP